MSLKFQKDKFLNIYINDMNSLRLINRDGSGHVVYFCRCGENSFHILFQMKDFYKCQNFLRRYRKEILHGNIVCKKILNRISFISFLHKISCSECKLHLHYDFSSIEASHKKGKDCKLFKNNLESNVVIYKENIFSKFIFSLISNLFTRAFRLAFLK